MGRPSPERIERIAEERAFAKLAVSRKKSAKARAADEAEGRSQQEAIRMLLQRLPDVLYEDRAEFLKVLSKEARRAEVKLTAPLRGAILNALSEPNETAEICRDKDGNPEPDTQLRDTESVPLSESVETFFEREVLPYVPDAWIDQSRRDHKDREVGIVGCEINFNRYFYVYEPPRPLEEIEADIREIEGEIVRMLGEVTGR